MGGGIVMYINFQLSSTLKLGDIEKLTAIKQREVEFIKQHISDDDLGRYEALSLITLVKAKNKNEDVLERLRLSEVGKKIMVELSFEGAVDEQTEQLYQWLEKIYKAKPNGVIKNKTACKKKLQWFKKITAIEGNYLALLLSCFIQDSFIPENPKNFHTEFAEFKKDNPRAVLSNMLDRVCFAEESMFDKHMTLDKSPLYRYYEDNMEYVKSVWLKNNLKI